MIEEPGAWSTSRNASLEVYPISNALIETEPC